MIDLVWDIAQNLTLPAPAENACDAYEAGGGPMTDYDDIEDAGAD